MRTITERVRLLNSDDRTKSLVVEIVIDPKLKKGLVLPKSVIDELGVKRIDTMTTEVSGDRVNTDPRKHLGGTFYGRILLELNGRTLPVNVFLEDAISQPVIGRKGLEELGIPLTGFPMGGVALCVLISSFGVWWIILSFMGDWPPIPCVASLVGLCGAAIAVFGVKSLVDVLKDHARRSKEWRSVLKRWDIKSREDVI